MILISIISFIYTLLGCNPYCGLRQKCLKNTALYHSCPSSQYLLTTYIPLLTLLYTTKTFNSKPWFCFLSVNVIIDFPMDLGNCLSQISTLHWNYYPLASLTLSNQPSVKILSRWNYKASNSNQGKGKNALGKCLHKDKANFMFDLSNFFQGKVVSIYIEETISKNKSNEWNMGLSHSQTILGQKTLPLLSSCSSLNSKSEPILNSYLF